MIQIHRGRLHAWNLRHLRYSTMSDALVNGVAGACGGILAQILTYPLQAVSPGGLLLCKSRFSSS